MLVPLWRCAVLCGRQLLYDRWMCALSLLACSAAVDDALASPAWPCGSRWMRGDIVGDRQCATRMRL